jgi:sulfate permease, SulP family
MARVRISRELHFLAIAGLVIAAGSSLPISIAGPDSSTSAVTAALVGTVTQHLAAAGVSDRLLVASLVIMPISSALTGLLLCGLGTARAGRAIRFVPYPVVGDFLGATGLLVMLGACQVINEHRFTLADGMQFITIANVSQLAAGIAVATLLFLFLRIRVTSATVMPLILLASSTSPT